MKTRAYILLFLLAVLVGLAAAALQPAPGYMDAEYYYSGGLRLVDGYGFSEPFLWNYLDDPSGLPHPSHTYWMPLSSLLSALGMWLTGSRSFLAGRLMFILLSAGVPPLTAALATSFGFRPGNAWLAGLLACFPGFYIVYVSIPDGFPLYMLLGGAFFLVAFPRHASRQGWITQPFFLGVIAGLMHLARADGILWLGAALVTVLWQVLEKREAGFFTRSVICVLAVLVGYAAIMAPWYGRNLQIFGTLFAPGGGHTLWLRNYNQTFIYPASELSFIDWLAGGWQPVILDRLRAFASNLVTWVGVQSEVFLFPFLLVGLWRRRRQSRVQLGVLMGLVTFGVMTLVFPFAGARGGFFHSGAALQPLLWVLAVDGLTAAVAAGARWRKWDLRQAHLVFGTAVVLLGFGLSVFLFNQRVLGGDWQKPVWSESQRQYEQVGIQLADLGAGDADVILVNNPPGFYVATGRSAIVIPDGGIDVLLQVAKRYRAGYLVLEANHVDGLDFLYENPRQPPLGLVYLRSAAGVHYFQIGILP